MKNPYDTAQELAAKKLALASENYSHILRVERDIETMEGIAYTLEQTMIDAQANNPDDLCGIMVLQARMLDGLFHSYLGESNTHPARRDPKIETALRMQNQLVRTLNTWKKLKTETYIVRKLIKIYPREKFDDERTGQTDPFHRPDTPHRGGAADDGL